MTIQRSDRRTVACWLSLSNPRSNKRGAPECASLCRWRGLTGSAALPLGNAGQAYSANCAAGALFSAALIEIRIGRTTNSAIATTMKFMIAATAKTACQLPV